QCPLYDPELDLAVETADARVAGYSLYWFDPVTKTGLVEPVRVEDDYQRRPSTGDAGRRTRPPRTQGRAAGEDRLHERRCRDALREHRVSTDLERHVVRGTGRTPGRHPERLRDTAASRASGRSAPSRPPSPIRTGSSRRSRSRPRP